MPHTFGLKTLSPSNLSKTTSGGRNKHLPSRHQCNIFFHLNVKLVLVYYRGFYFLFVVLRISGVAVNCSIWHQRLLVCRTVLCGTRPRPSGQRSCPRCSVDFRSFEKFRRHFFITCSQCLAEQLTVKVQFWCSVLQRGAKMADCVSQLNLLSFGF